MRERLHTKHALLTLVLLVAAPRSGVTQEGAGPVTPDSADAIRASLAQPPAKPRFDAVDAIALPFRVLALPLQAVGYGLAELAGLASSATAGAGTSRVPVVDDLADAGVSAGLGSIGPRSGVAARARYEGIRPFFAEAAFSIRTSQRYRAGLLVGQPERWSLEGAYTFWRNAAPYFWGVGMGTTKGGRSVYLWDQQAIALTGATGARLASNAQLWLTADASFEDNRIGRSADLKDTPAIQDVPEFADLYGVEERTNYLRIGATAALDLAYAAGLQRRGLALQAGAAAYRGVDGSDSDFHRIDLAFLCYLPLNPRQQLALLIIAESNLGDGGAGVPFYHLASLGDSRGARSLDQDRFRDLAMSALMAEWRYEVWREPRERARVESFFFYDTGAVAERLRSLSWGARTESFGLGWRLLTRRGGRFVNYLAFGKEGLRFRITFSTALP